ncbi:MAG: PrsW family glutamic-type intramembrane protease [Flavobacteriales bacterium]|nr:PrsW family glutamic-type intramembrane protease [Flavobacteriales bacterium]
MILMGLAIAPGIGLAIYIYFRDKYDKEPLWILLISFFMGILSTIPTIISEVFVANIPLIEQRVFLLAFFGIAFIEEFWKMFFVMIYAYRKKAFDEPYDGITYCVMVSMGFATAENVLYVMEGGWSVALLRMFTAVPAHATFGIMMGYFMGLAKFSIHLKFLYLVTAFLSAAIFHGGYDYFLLVQNIPGIWLGAFVSLGVAVYLSLRAIKIHSRNSPFGTTATTDFLT